MKWAQGQVYWAYLSAVLLLSEDIAAQSNSKGQTVLDETNWITSEP